MTSATLLEVLNWIKSINYKIEHFQMVQHTHDLLVALAAQVTKEEEAVKATVETTVEKLLR